MCALSLIFTYYLYCIYLFNYYYVYEEIYLKKKLAHEAVGSTWVNLKAEEQACRLEPQAGAAVLRQNFFLLQEASGCALTAFD